MFNVVFGPGYWPLNIYPGRLFTGFTNILRFPHRTSASAMTCRIKSGEYCAPMSDVITICLNFELNEVRLIGAAYSRNYGAGRKFEFLSATAQWSRCQLECDKIEQAHANLKWSILTCDFQKYLSQRVRI